MNPSDDFTSSVFDATEALRAAINEPIDQIRLLSGLACWTTPYTSMADTAMASLCRRAALCSLALATADWQPTNAAETREIIESIHPLFDAEIQLSADIGDTETYTQLTTLRCAVLVDLATRGSLLPELITLTRPAPMPSLKLAWDIYADALREPDIVQRNNNRTIHTAFMPVTLEVLSW